MPQDKLEDIKMIAILLSHPLKRIITHSDNKLDANIQSIKGISSACIVKYKDEFFLFSVAHNLGDDANCSLWLMTDDEKNRLVPLDEHSFPVVVEGNNAEKIDFLMAKINSEAVCYHVFRDEKSLAVINRYQRFCFTSEQITDVTPADRYFFAGNTQPCNEGMVFASSYIIEEDMRYIESEGYYDYFLLNSTHKGHNHYEGTSGAPIINQQGLLVGLVCDGRRSEENLITGLSLTRCKNIIDGLIVAFEKEKVK